MKKQNTACGALSISDTFAKGPKRIFPKFARSHMYKNSSVSLVRECNPVVRDTRT